MKTKLQRKYGNQNKDFVFLIKLSIDGNELKSFWAMSSGLKEFQHFGSCICFSPVLRL